MLGETGTGNFFLIGADSLTPSATLVGTFQLESQGILDGESFAPPPGLQVLVRPGDKALGPIKAVSLPLDEPTPCFPGHQLETLSLTLPDGMAPVRLPAERRIDRPEFTYTSQWSVQDHVLAVRRELQSRIATPLCEGSLRQATAEALRIIRRDWTSTVTLEPVPAEHPGN